MSFEASMEPYAQLVRSLLPRAASVNLFDSGGKLLWSSAVSANSELFAVVLQAIAHLENDREGAGQHCVLPDDCPAYLFWLRDAVGGVAAIAAVVCARPASPNEVLPFSFVLEQLRPAIELLRRDLLARADIDKLNESLTARDKDLELLLSVTGSHPKVGGSDDLQSLLANAANHLKCVLAGIVVPDKGLTLTFPDTHDSSILARTQRQLLAITQTRRDPLVINKIATQAGQVAIPYRILACPLRQGSGRTSGVLALFRKLEAPEFVGRDVHLADLVAHKIAASIETSYDALSGLLTRAALEQRVKLMFAEAGARVQRWSLLYVDIDELHVINENFGMHVGDQAIAQIGDLLRKHLPASSFASRISGDRFAVVMPSEMDEAAMFGEGLREGVTRLSTAHVDARYRLSISLGVTPFSGRDGELGRSLAEAESACKAAKDRGRNRLETFQENDVSIIRRFTDINVATDVRGALAENRLRLEAQLIAPFTNHPQNETHAKPHYELLLRMLDPEGNTIGPDRFLSAALRYPDDAHHRPLGDRHRHRNAASAPRAAREGAGVLHHQFLRPVIARRRIRRLRDPQHRDQPHQPGRVLLRAHRERRGGQHQRRGETHGAPPQAGLRRGAGRLRHRAVFAVIPAIDAGDACSRSMAASCATSCVMNAPSRWCAPSRSWRAP